MRFHICDQCGFEFPGTETHCLKCDFPAHGENWRSCWEVDIAHQGQTLAQAIEEFQTALRDAKNRNYGSMRLIVGGGKIGYEIQRDLDAAEWRGQIQSYQRERANYGAFLIQLNPTRP